MMFDKKMKFLVIGASGLVGNALLSEAKKRGHEVTGTYFEHPLGGLQKLDYGDTGELKKIIEKFTPEVILCPVGVTNVDWVEQNPQEAWKKNVLNLNTLFETAASFDIPIAFFSTDYIFDGKSGPYPERLNLIL